MSENNNAEVSAERPTGAISDALREHLHCRQTICAELENLASRQDIADYATEVSRLCTAFTQAPAVPPEFEELLNKRFSEALDRAKAGEALFHARIAECEKLEKELDALLATGELATLAEAVSLEKRWRDLNEGAGEGEFLTKLAPLLTRLKQEAAELQKRSDAAVKLTEELNALTEAEDIAPLKARKSEIEKAYAALGTLPRNIVNAYQEAHRKASLKLAQHFETLDLARWESYTLKLDICNTLEKLCAEPEAKLGKAAKTLNELREKWKTLGSVPKAKNDEINPRYLSLTRTLQNRVDEYFTRKRQEIKQAVAAKTELCEKAEALAESREWNVTSEAFKALQQQWKTFARAGGAEENALYSRFRAAADHFFNARKAYWEEKDKVHGEAAERKKLLIAEAQNLTDVRRAKQLREEYRTIGSAGRAEAELYREFDAAIEKFFSGRNEEFAAKEKKAQELVAELTSLAADPLPNLNRARGIRQELQQLNCRNTRKEEQKAEGFFDAALTSARRSQQTKQLADAREAALALARAYDKFRAGEACELPPEADSASFAKLRNARHLLEQAVSGDEKAREKLDKQILTARSERERVCAELEKLTGGGEEKTSAGPNSLAAELEAAILGNFAKAEAKASAQLQDPQALRGEFLNSGLLPEAELASLFDRFDRACTALNLK